MPEAENADAPATLDGRIAPFVWSELPVERLILHGDSDTLGASTFVACVPACNEAGWIERCLAALGADLEPSDGIIVLANGCEDATVPLALARLGRMERPWLLVECRWRQARGTAPFARRLAFDIATGLAPEAVLLSIDGDTLVLPGLRAAYADAFAQGFDLVCGRIGFLPEEAALLPPADPQSEAVIRCYREASREIAALIRPDPDNFWPHHGNIGGANFAMRGAAYRASGRLPVPSSGEDRALRRRFEASGLRIRYSDAPCVETSCRLVGRAAGGLSDELRRNRTEADPVVDEALEPPEKLLLRCRSRASYLEARHFEDRMILLDSLGVSATEALRYATFGGEAGWQAVEDASPRLRRHRLRLEDLKRHLPALLQTLGAIRDARSGSPASPAR